MNIAKLIRIASKVAPAVALAVPAVGTAVKVAKQALKDERRSK